MQMGAYNTIPFFRVDKVCPVCWCRRNRSRSCDSVCEVYGVIAHLQGFVAQCTDVLGNRLVPLNARQQVRLWHTCAAPIAS
jgi:hypothetical protein